MQKIKIWRLGARVSWVGVWVEKLEGSKEKEIEREGGVNRMRNEKREI